MKLRYLLVAILSVCGFNLVAMPTEPEEIEVASDSIIISNPDQWLPEAIDSICNSYPEDWQQLSMQGKLSFEGLPVRPTVKIYMKRGESILMSARAPIVGEVARVEINNDSITIINKHSRKYWSQRLEGYTSPSSSVVSDLQDVLLGYVAYPGFGRFDSNLAAGTDWSITPKEDVFIQPLPDYQYPGVEYGFILDQDSYRMKSFIIMLLSSGSVLETSYLYGNAGWTFGLNLYSASAKLGGEIQLSYPDYNPTPLEFTNAGEKYSSSDIKGLLKF